ELLSDKSEAILLSLHIAPRNACGMAWLSVTQGILHLAECTHDELADWLERIAPSELLVSASITPKWEQQLQSMRLGQRGMALSLTLRPDFQYEAGLGHSKLIKQLNVASLAAWDADKLSHAHAAAGALLTYAEHTQGRSLPHVSQLKVQKANELIDLPTSTRRNLELTQTLRGEDSPTLFSLLDTCMTGMGSRQLKQWLLNPPRDRQVAVERLDALDQLNDNSAAAQSGMAIWARLREQLKGASDVERITARIALKQVRPRELVALKNALIRSASLSHHLQDTLGHLSPTKLLHDIHVNLQPPVGLTEILQQALLEEPANLIRDGGVMANGLDAELDELRAIQTNCDDFLLELETREKARTGIANLKVQFNRVHGFYIEVTQGQIDKVPDDYRRRQTLKNAERFITPELKAFEDKALSAQERALAREKYLYEILLDQLQTHIQALTQLAQAMAALDALCTLTERAITLNWCAPQFAKEPCIEIRQGRHPVVEARLAETSGGNFIANDCLMNSKQRLQIITGPNMGGKSTYMRQVALIVLLASIGSHVPASSCRLGPIDAIHTRIGAADDLANAQSTFMLEMTEAAQILHSATPLSLVLMDEIGRGTSTFDGLALASGIATHLHDKTQAFSLFATHYFELTEFPATHHAALNMHVGATESGNDIVFLHELQAGPASKSYGVQVARLAGMPTSVLSHARHTLTALEAGANENRIQVDLFAPPPESEHAGPSALEAALNQIDPDALSPREALEALYSLQRVLKRSEN
ncbi:MAG: mismatch repair protein MutS, partial [Pseudomonadota bacterium]